MSPYVRRAPHFLRLQLSRSGVAARGACRSGGAVWVSGARAARSRRRVRRAAFSSRGSRCGYSSDHRCGTHAQSCQLPATSFQLEARSSKLAARSLEPGAWSQIPPPRARRIRRGLPKPLPADHAHEAARAERRGRAHARRSRGTDRRPRGAGGTSAAGVRALRRRRSHRSARRALRARSCLCRDPAPSPARPGGRQPRAHRSGRRVSSADRGDQRRSLRESGRAVAVRRAHVHPSQNRSGTCRPEAGAQCRALSQTARSRWRRSSATCRRR